MAYIRYQQTETKAKGQVLARLVTRAGNSLVEVMVVSYLLLNLNHHLITVSKASTI